jgi:murein tripeptide amidase MpaA
MMRLKRITTVWLAVMLLATLSTSTLTSARATPVESPQLAQDPQGLVVRIHYADRSDLAQLATRYDVWEVHANEQYIVAAVRPDEYLALIAQGYKVEIDLEKTAALNRPRSPLPGQVNGIPGYPCYRTVEETFATAQTIVANYPNLAEWIDIGDSWDKVTAGGNLGYDMLVLKLTNHSIPGPKPKLFIMSAIHAREYTTAELNTRFAEQLVNNYGIDPDVTWLLDYNEIHLLLQSNPDGRKMAETGLSWRKNVDNNYCANTNSRGADLNRNFPFHWGGPGASTFQCDETYRGASAASEPETQAVVNYVRSEYPDLRNDDLVSAAPITTSGIFVDLHSFSQLVLWPWGDTTQVAPNGPALQTLGRKFAFFNNYTPEQSVGLYPTSGTTDDTAYGERGVPAFTIEMGTDFFETCTSFENTTLPANMPALFYAAKAARRPYMTPAGPDVLSLTAAPTTTVMGAQVILNATANDTRYLGGEPTQKIAGARYTIDAPSWITDVVTHALSPADGGFSSPVEAIRATIDTTSLGVGRHIIYVEAQDAAGNWGVPTAVFVWISGAPDSGLTGAVTTQGTGVPIAGALIQASQTPTLTFNATSDASGSYTKRVVPGTYTLNASKYGYQSATIPNVLVNTGVTTTQNITLTPVVSHVVSGTVRDATTGWPLPATIDIGGYPNSPIVNNPATGFYSLSMAEGITYTFGVNATVPGYLPQARSVGPLTSDRIENFDLSVDAAACIAPGYAFAGLYQTFDAATTPAGWTVVNNVGSVGWSFDNPGGRSNSTGGAGNMAIADSDHAGAVNMDTELRSPVMDLTTLSVVTLTFKTDFFYYTGGLSEVADVDVSTSGGAGPWTNVWRKTSNYRGPHTETIDLTSIAAGHNSVMMRFHYYNANNEWWWQVDDVQLGKCIVSYASVPSLSPTLASGEGEPGSTVTYTLHMSNTGNLTDTFTLSAANNVWPTVLAPITATLAPSQTASLIVSVTIPITTPGGTLDVATITMAGSGAQAHSTVQTLARWPVNLFLPVVIKDLP